MLSRPLKREQLLDLLNLEEKGTLGFRSAWQHLSFFTFQHAHLAQTGAMGVKWYVPAPHLSTRKCRPLNLFLSKSLKIDGLEVNSALQSAYPNHLSAEVTSSRFTAASQRELKQFREVPDQGHFQQTRRETES